MSARTPGTLSRNIPPITKYPTLFAGRNSHVCVMTTQGVKPEEVEANAEFILKAWNCHDDLVAALIHDAQLRAIVNGDKAEDWRDYTSAVANAALAKAGAL